MSMFRLAEKVPSAYIEQSRDFQLLCNLFDLVQNSTKFEIDNMLRILDTSQCPDKLLPLLQTKVGFFPDSSELYGSEQLRDVLTSFIHIVKLKGSRKGILAAANTFIKCLNIDCTTSVSFGSDDDPNVVVIHITAPVTDSRILTDILHYVIPAGYRYKYEIYTTNTPHVTVEVSTGESDSDRLIKSSHNSFVYNCKDNQGANVSTGRIRYIDEGKSTNEGIS